MAETEYPKIKKLAQTQGADIYFGDAAHIRSDHHAGRTWGKKGETPVVEATGARHGISLISAITSKGHMRFMIKEKGGVNSAVFIEFLQRLLVGARQTIFLIVDRGPRTVLRRRERLSKPWAANSNYFIYRLIRLTPIRMSWCGSI